MIMKDKTTDHHPACQLSVFGHHQQQKYQYRSAPTFHHQQRQGSRQVQFTNLSLYSKIDDDDRLIFSPSGSGGLTKTPRPADDRRWPRHAGHRPAGCARFVYAIAFLGFSFGVHLPTYTCPVTYRSVRSSNPAQCKTCLPCHRPMSRHKTEHMPFI